MSPLNWKEIKDEQYEKQFYYRGKPVFKKFISILKFHEPGFAPVEDETGWYHIKTDGTPLYAQRYTRTFGFYCGRAAVTEHRCCYHITPKGEPAYKNRYSWCGNFQENICTVRLHTDYFHIDKDGKLLYSEKYLYAGDFRDGVACVKCQDKLWRHICTDGSFLNGKGFLDLGVFHKNIAPARDDVGFFHSDIYGIPLYPERYLIIEDFYNGFALVTDFNWQKKVINEKGEVVLCL